MGIRINKVLGYGLTDVANKDYRITDPRINADSFLLGETPPIEDYIAYVERTTDKDDFNVQLEVAMLKEHTGRDADSHGLCTWQSEYGLPNVLVLRPFGFDCWYRHDDPIDYEEEAIRGTTMEYRVQHTLGGIHGFAGFYMDARTGKRFTGRQADLVGAWRKLVNAPLRDGVSEADRIIVLDKVAQRLELGFTNHTEAERCIVPWVPDEIRRVCAWGNLFTSPEVCFQLRPLLYTYWA